MEWLYENLELFVFLINLFFVIAGFAGSALLFFALKRFENCELHSFMKLFAFSVIFTVIYKTIDVISTYSSFSNYWLFFIAHFSLLIAIVMVFFAGTCALKYTNPKLSTPKQ